MKLRAFVQQVLILQDRIPVSSWDRPMEFTTMDGTIRYVASSLAIANGRVRVTLERKPA